jgi:hypothetical protein
MGNATAALAEGAGEVFVSPAAVGFLRSPEFSMTYGKPYVGLPDSSFGLGFLSFAMPTKAGNLGFGLASFQASGLKEERTLAVAYGANLLGQVRLGVMGKQLYHRYTPVDSLAVRDPVFRKGTSKSVLSLDLGVNGSFWESIRWGLAIRNLNHPDVGLTTEDRVVQEMQAGVALDLRKLGLKITGDLLYRQKLFLGGRDVLPFFGLEKSFRRDAFSFRFGANPNQWTTGLGLHRGRLGLDYGLVLIKALSQDNSGSHHVQVTYRFKTVMKGEK